MSSPGSSFGHPAGRLPIPRSWVSKSSATPPECSGCKYFVANWQNFAPGTYTVTITATNADGSDTCTTTVTVGDTFCDEVTELNTVYFDFDSSALTADARARLDENLEVLRRCPNICVVINGYTDDVEEDKLRLSQRRADEVRAYYVANGITEDRLRARGLGEAPDANNKEDPGPGDSRARRADSLPTSCAGF